jgi:DNA-directed RNA polymerase specialized sigma24 family protein
MAIAIRPALLNRVLDDRDLARLAMSGEGEAFAELYDRHERRVFGFCARMLDTHEEAAEATQETFKSLLEELPALEGRDVNFVACALTSARNCCRERIDGRRPRSAPLVSERERAVLALRELERLSYEQIGELLGMSGNGVAQLIARARTTLGEQFHAGIPRSGVGASPECARALPLLARVQDAQRRSAQDFDWLQRHIAACEACQLSRISMREAGESYRALAPSLPVRWLRGATIERAAELVGADWSDISRSPRRGPQGQGATRHTVVPQATRTGLRRALARARRSG